MTLAFTVHKDKDRFRLVGTVVTQAGARCSRCLEPFTLPVNAAFDLRYLPARNGRPGFRHEDVELADEDTSDDYYRGDEIDLGELMREQFYLALPMKPLCRQDCKGLCPQCGINLNTETCQCEIQWEDPRLAGLKALITDREDRRCLIQNVAIPRPAAVSAAPTTPSPPPTPAGARSAASRRRAHRVCAYCGHYRARQVRPVNEE